MIGLTICWTTLSGYVRFSNHATNILLIATVLGNLLAKIEICQIELLHEN